MVAPRSMPRRPRMDPATSAKVLRAALSAVSFRVASVSASLLAFIKSGRVWPVCVAAVSCSAVADAVLILCISVSMMLRTYVSPLLGRASQCRAVALSQSRSDSQWPSAEARPTPV